MHYKSKERLQFYPYLTFLFFAACFATLRTFIFLMTRPLCFTSTSLTLGKTNFILTSYALMRRLTGGFFAEFLGIAAAAADELLAELLSEIRLLFLLLLLLIGLTIGLAGGLAGIGFLPISLARFLARFPNGLLAGRLLAGLAAAEVAVELAVELSEELIFLVAATLCLSKINITPLLKINIRPPSRNRSRSRHFLVLFL